VWHPYTHGAHTLSHAVQIEVIKEAYMMFYTHSCPSFYTNGHVHVAKINLEHMSCRVWKGTIVTMLITLEVRKLRKDKRRTCLKKKKDM
jgi:hypothetical protein